ASVMGYDFKPNKGQAIHKDVTYELEQYPEDKTEPNLEKHVAPAIRVHMKDFLAAIASRSKPVADIEQGYISTAACILANLSMQLGRSLKWDAGGCRNVTLLNIGSRLHPISSFCRERRGHRTMR